VKSPRERGGVQNLLENQCWRKGEKLRKKILLSSNLKGQKGEGKVKRNLTIRVRVSESGAHRERTPARENLVGGRDLMKEGKEKFSENGRNGN